jgi:hypothetical protein
MQPLTSTAQPSGVKPGDANLGEDVTSARMAEITSRLQYFSYIFSETMAQFSGVYLQRLLEAAKLETSNQRPSAQSPTAEQQNLLFNVVQQKLTAMIAVLLIIQRLPHKTCVRALLATLLESNIASTSNL